MYQTRLCQCSATACASGDVVHCEPGDRLPSSLPYNFPPRDGHVFNINERNIHVAPYTSSAASTDYFITQNRTHDLRQPLKISRQINDVRHTKILTLHFLLSFYLLYLGYSWAPNCWVNEIVNSHHQSSVEEKQKQAAAPPRVITRCLAICLPAHTPLARASSRMRITPLAPLLRERSQLTSHA